LPIFEVDIGKVLIKAKSEKYAKLGACGYVAEDLGIECLTAKRVKTKEYDYEY
jgi:hypothetical protein